MAAKNIDASAFKTEVLEADLPVLVDFWAPWCQPCLAMAPILDEISTDPDFSTKLRVLKMNTDMPQNQYLAVALKIMSIPNMKLFHKGKLVHEFIGMRPAAMFKQELSDVLATIN
jgi:thioredoxin 1